MRQIGKCAEALGYQTTLPGVGGKIRNDHNFEDVAFIDRAGAGAAQSFEIQSRARRIGADSRNFERPPRGLKRIVMDESPHRGSIAGVERRERGLRRLHERVPLLSE